MTETAPATRVRLFGRCDSCERYGTITVYLPGPDQAHRQDLCDECVRDDAAP